MRTQRKADSSARHLGGAGSAVGHTAPDAWEGIRETVAEDGHVYAEIWGRPAGTEVSMTSKRVSSGPTSTSWVTYQEVTEGEKVLFDGVLHRDTYEPLAAESGEPLPNAEPAPVNP